MYSKTLAFIFIFLLSAATYADTYVDGYQRNNGTYVQPHYRSDTNNNVRDNWSTKGNTNPYTGKEGYRNPNN